MGLPQSSALFLPKDWLPEILSRGDCSFLAGAGVCVASGLPVANEFVVALINGLIEAAGVGELLRPELRERLEQHRLEYVLQVASQTPGVDAISCLESLNGGEPNLLHIAVAECLARSRRSKPSVMTTNFDQLFEQALERSGIQSAVLVAPDFDRAPHSGVNVLKLHGSLGPTHTDSALQLAATLDLIGRSFSESDRELLTELAGGGTLIVLGYSGNDHHDVVPWIFDHKFERMVWLQHDNSLQQSQVSAQPPPEHLNSLFRGAEDIYVRCNTAQLFAIALDTFGKKKFSSLESRFEHPWRSRLAGWTASVGRRAGLILADLLIREREFRTAAGLYERCAAAFVEEDEADLRVKAKRNVAAIQAEQMGDPGTAVVALTKLLETESAASEESKIGVLIELGLACKAASVHQPECINDAIHCFFEADRAAEKAGSKKLRALALRNLGITFQQAAYNGDFEFDPAIDAAGGAFEGAMALFVERNEVERILNNTTNLVACYILREEWVKATHLSAFAASYARLMAYADGGLEVRKWLGYAASTAALASFVQEVPMVESVPGVLLPMGAWQPVVDCALEAFKGHLAGAWGSVSSGREFVELVRRQATEFAEGKLAALHISG